MFQKLLWASLFMIVWTSAEAAPPRTKSGVEILRQTIVFADDGATADAERDAEVSEILKSGPIRVGTTEYYDVLLGLYYSEMEVLDEVSAAGVEMSARLHRPIPFSETDATSFIDEVPPVDELAWRYADIVVPSDPARLNLDLDLLSLPLTASETPPPPPTTFSSCTYCAYRCQKPYAGYYSYSVYNRSCSSCYKRYYVANASSDQTKCC